MHFGKKTSQLRWCDVLGNVLMSNMGPDLYMNINFHIIFHILLGPSILTLCRTSIPFMAIVFPIASCLFRNGLKKIIKSKRCWLDLQIPPGFNVIAHLLDVLEKEL